MTNDWLAQAAAAHPDRPALLAPSSEFGAPTLTFAELDAAVSALAGRLSAAGIAPGMRVGWWGRSPRAGVHVLLALMRLGATSVPLNTRLTGSEVQAQLNTARCAHLIVESGSTAPPTIHGCGILALDQLPALSYPLPALGWADDRVQGILFTSGTTGQSKAAQITFANLRASAEGSGQRLGVRPDDRWLLSLPLYHIGAVAMVFRCLLHAVGLAEFDLSGGFDPRRLASILNDPELAVTHVSLVPTMLYRLLETDFSAPPHLRCILLGGAAADVNLLMRAKQRGLPISVTYGLTEATSQVATLPPERLLEKPGTVGQPLPNVNVSIVDEDGQPLPPGRIGEIVVRGPTVFAGYLGQPEARVLRDGALFTGDLGYLDADGDLWPVQRRTDLIISGGENVYPAEVEAVLREHPAIADACVVGIPSPEWGQIVGALIVTRERQPFDEAAVSAYVRTHLAGYKVPRLYRIVDALPLTAGGKLDRRAATALLIDRMATNPPQAPLQG